MAPKTTKKPTGKKSFSWDGELGDYIKQQIKDGMLPREFTREHYRIIYEAFPEGVLNFQKFSASFANAERNTKKDTVLATSQGARRKEVTMKSATPGSGLSNRSGEWSSKKLQSTTKNPAMLDTDGKFQVWETLHSYWRDNAKNLRLQFWVVLPSGCRKEDIVQTAIAPGGRSIKIVHKWPEYIFDAKRLFQGQWQNTGAVTTTAGSSKASGLETTTQEIRESNKAAVATNLTIHLERKVEANWLEMSRQNRPFTRFRVTVSGPNTPSL
ncbi:hypothetical protein ACA910_021662 [Epithemia clementina (nom. ined.)]